MPARQRLRATQRVAVTAAALGLAATALAPAASAHDQGRHGQGPQATTSHSQSGSTSATPRYFTHHGKTYRVTTCTDDAAYYCITKKGSSTEAWRISKSDPKATWITKLAAAPVSWYAVKHPWASKVIVLKVAKYYQVVSWCWR